MSNTTGVPNEESAVANTANDTASKLELTRKAEAR